MNKKLITYLLVFFFVAPSAWAQVDTTRTDTTASDTTTAPADTSETEPEDIMELDQWYHSGSTGYKTTATDSTLRWEIWPDWADNKSREPGVITYRLGTQNRNTGMLIDAHESRYQTLYWENFSLNDPATGAAIYEFIPMEKINRLQVQTNGLGHETRFNLRQYYLNKPLTNINYTESANDFRNMSFMVSQNINQRTNTEISYRNERDGGGYSNSETVGQQIYARISHFLDNEQLIKAHYLNNSFDNQEPFGYQIQNMEIFNFDQFGTQPSESSAESELVGSTFGMNYYKRDQDSERTADNFRTGLSLNTIRRSISSTTDTTSYKVRTAGVNARKWFSSKEFELETGMAYRQHFNLDRQSLATSGWGSWQADASAEYQTPLPFFKIDGGGEVSGRTDGYLGYEFKGRGILNIGPIFQVTGAVASGSKKPTPQQLYWASEEYSGDRSLRNETIHQAFGMVELTLVPPFSIGVKSQIKDIDGAILPDQNGTFTNIDRYNSFSVTPYAAFNSTHFEVEGSATYQQYGNWFNNSAELLSVDPNKRVWLKGSAYIKGYLFDRATYVKAGLSGMMAPFRYRAGQYNPVLNTWRPGMDESPLPVYNRLDADLSARVRSLMVLLRYENVLDEVAQLGYFETANYPMPARRFMVGLRVLFRN